MLGSRLIGWSRKNQVVISLSLTEAYYRGVVNATMQVVWLHGIMTNFGIHTSPLVDLFCDNQSAIKISSDPIHKQLTKYIEVHMHYIWELVHSKAIILHYCPIEE